MLDTTLRSDTILPNSPAYFFRLNFDKARVRGATFAPCSGQNLAFSPENTKICLRAFVKLWLPSNFSPPPTSLRYCCCVCRCLSYFCLSGPVESPLTRREIFFIFFCRTETFGFNSHLFVALPGFRGRGGRASDLADVAHFTCGARRSARARRFECHVEPRSRRGCCRPGRAFD